MYSRQAVSVWIGPRMGHGGMGRYGGSTVRWVEVQGGMEVRGAMGSYGEIWGGMGRYGEVWGGAEVGGGAIGRRYGGTLARVSSLLEDFWLTRGQILKHFS